MTILKIRDKGLYLEIPGLKPTRTPVEIDITKFDISIIMLYLRKQGIKDFQILSTTKKEKQIVEVKKKKPLPEKNIDISDRFSRLEHMVGQLLEKSKVNTNQKLEQNIEMDTIKTKKSKVINDDPDIEELDTEKFIPNVDISDMKIKGSVKNTIKQDNIDLSDSVDLLSRIMGQED